MTLSDIKKLACADRNKHLFEESSTVSGKAGKKPNKVPKKVPVGLQFIKRVLDENKVPFCTELQFAKPRKFRFDVAIPALMIAIEYEGLVATGKKGGHQTKAHYTENCTKYNLAADKGWKLYRYTCRNYRNFENDLKGILKK